MGFLILAGSILLSGGGEGEVARFKQDRFVIGSWVAPPLDERAEERYREMADAHFNLVIHGAHTPEEIARQLAICAQFDLQVLVSYPGEDATNQIRRQSACFRARRPSARDSRRWPIRCGRAGKVARKLALHQPLFPAIAVAGERRAPTLPGAREPFCGGDRHIDVLSMDSTPSSSPMRTARRVLREPEGMSGSLRWRRGIPFWNFFNIMPYGPHTDPTESQVRWQVFASLAHGARGSVLLLLHARPGGSSQGARSSPAIIAARVTTTKPGGSTHSSAISAPR